MATDHPVPPTLDNTDLPELMGWGNCTRNTRCECLEKVFDMSTYTQPVAAAAAQYSSSGGGAGTSTSKRQHSPDGDYLMAAAVVVVQAPPPPSDNIRPTGTTIKAATTMAASPLAHYQLQ
ncbi:MAG: hypothetical protein M1826_004926 [Phylliscum demangeonii]|nr:MAG: hypothetical protein M1826_004926 [Phylliscum demangeonii]